MNKTKTLFGLLILVSLLAGCMQPLPPSQAAYDKPNMAVKPIFKPTNTPKPAPVDNDLTSTQTASTTVINPLTGLPMDNPDYLHYSPILVSVSNFPVSVRPQSGLSYAPHVYEMTIGEGMTRFLAVFYGSYGPSTQMDQKLGSIRSGRLPYEPLRQMYDGEIVMAGSAKDVGAKLSATVFRQSVTFNEIKDLAQDRTIRKGNPEFAPIVANASVPGGGLDGSKLEIIWSRLNRVRWTYDTASGTYLREQDKSDGKATYYPTTDKLTGKQLAFDNVVLLAVEHEYLNPTKIEMNLQYIQKEPAIFFRDGKAYKIYWSTLAPLGPIKFFNEDGTPFAYKPGNTWFEIIHNLGEATQATDGGWNVRFFNP
jgi:hypothetical protein